MTDPTRPAAFDAAALSLTNGYAVASLVLGIVWVFWIGSFLAVIFGHTARAQIRRSGIPRGEGMALAGLILGYLGFLTLVISIVGGGGFHLQVNL